MLVVLVIVLIVTNLAALLALAYARLRPPDPSSVPRAPDDLAAAALDRTPRPAGADETRRLISIEILNPIELAGTRGRLVGIAGSLAPKLTRRIVYDQTLKLLKQQLGDHHVVADVRLHTLRPTPRGSGRPGEPVVDEVEHVDLDALDDPPGRSQPL